MPTANNKTIANGPRTSGPYFSRYANKAITKRDQGITFYIALPRAFPLISPGSFVILSLLHLSSLERWR